MDTSTDIGRIQEVLLEMLKDLSAQMDKESARYYMSGGCVLGAVRHGGFIPWDDDIDLAVFEEDIPALERALERLDKKKYSVQRPLEGTHSKDFYLISRIGTTHITDAGRNRMQRISIEIHVLHPVPDGGWELALYHGMMRVFNLDSMMTQYMPGTICKGSVSVMRGLSKVLDMFRNRCSMRYYEPRNSFYSRDRLDKEIYGTPKEMRFEDGSFPFPEQTDAYLKRFYNNYMELPPEEKRVPRKCLGLSFTEDYYDYIRRGDRP